ncbi:MAG: phosphatidylglycerophosphatase A [Planctomycetes bacterium]|nr:phosphatidylglycerophosphatase A [Planctomycetota bacterium]
MLTGVGLGRLPVAPGTAATAAAAGVTWGLTFVPGFAAWWLTVAMVAASAAGLPLFRWGEGYFGRKDPREVVIDEFAGYFCTLALVPLLPVTPISIVAAFVLFRAFDIVKPPPVRACERIGGPSGILWDDLMAGAMAHAAMWGLSAAGALG